MSNVNNQARREILGISADLKWSVIELRRISERLEASGNMPDAQAILRMIQSFQQGESRLNQIAGDADPNE
ncbi:hypothetical protein AO242_21135 [Pseudomonas sp. ICMP 561]|nr:hypothetical protein AO242_21135 [Pseudomonas sp. ICMP 561]